MVSRWSLVEPVMLLTMSVAGIMGKYFYYIRAELDVVNGKNSKLEDTMKKDGNLLVLPRCILIKRKSLLEMNVMSV